MKTKKESTNVGTGKLETKEEKLKRLANARVSVVLKKISLVGNLASYKPTAEQSAQIVKALRGAVDSVAARLAGNTSSDFQL